MKEIINPRKKVVWKLKLSIFKPCNVAKIFQIEVKLNKNKRKALEFSTSNFSGTYAKEVEAYILEDKPKKVKLSLIHI